MGRYRGQQTDDRIEGRQMTLQEKINALTAYELNFLIDNPDMSAEVAEFFANGGFCNKSPEYIERVYQMKLGADK